MMDYEDYIEEPEGETFESIADPYFLDAQKDIRELYEANKDNVYFIRQLQVKFEKKYFHWITNNAIIGLYKIGYLKDLRIPKASGTSTRYFFHKSNRYPKRTINEMEKIIEEYSQDHITRSCGHRAEDLFCIAFAKHGFMPISSKVREFNKKKWERSNNDLDFVFERDGIAYGCEIKNKLGYIEKKELEIKLEMCAFFGVKPLFIMRYSPKTYNKMIYENGGYAMIYEAQIYELSQEELVSKIKKVLGLPVICSKAIPDGIMERFERWHVKQIA